MEKKNIIKAINKCQKSSNPKAFKLLYDHFSSQIYAVCLRYLRREADAQDILQETFITAYYQIEKYEFKGPFGAWITRIAVNNCLQKLRKEKKEIIIVQDFDQPEVETMENSFMLELNLGNNSDPAAIVMALLNELPLGYKTILNLSIVEGYAHKEIGQILNITESTSRSQLTRAKAALKKLIAKQEQKIELYD